MYNTIQYNTIQYNTIQYNIVYFQQRTQLHYNNNVYPTLGWLERGWTEESSYRGPPPTFNIHCQCKMKNKNERNKVHIILIHFI